MRIWRIVNLLKNTILLRHRGLWPALALSISFHGLFFYGLGKASSLKPPSGTRAGAEVLLIRLQVEPLSKPPSLVVHPEDQPRSDVLGNQAEQLGSLARQGATQSQPRSEDSVKSPLDQTPGSLDLDEHKGDIRCFGKKLENEIPDVGQSNRLERRTEGDLCEQG